MTWSQVEQGIAPDAFTMSSRFRRQSMSQTELQLFETAPIFPDGFRYEPELISAAEERRWVRELKQLPFKPFEFQGKRQVVSFGWRYGFNGGGLQRTDDIPGFLLLAQHAAAKFANSNPRGCNKCC